VRRVPTYVALAVGAWVLLLPNAGSGASPPIPDAPIAGDRTGFLNACSQLPLKPKTRCYVNRLLREVERLGNPATGLPAIDRKVGQTGGFLQAACHSFMHEVGRTWAKRHGVTIETMYRFVPRSNDPGCSAGFGMGMAMYLGPKLILEPRSVLRTCAQLPTRFRKYTCVHGAGHAFMRGFHGQLADSVRSCNTLGPTPAPDCAQGAFHDYWIALGGSDGTTRPRNAESSPEVVCGAFQYKRPCWYRYFWERRSKTRVYTADDILELCDDHEALQRAGCVGGSSLLISRERDPVDHARVCQDLERTDTYNCLRGVNVPALAGRRFEQIRLITTCDALPSETKAWCFNWFGRTLSVVTDGTFRERGCRQLDDEHERASCLVGGARVARPLRTFS
jgi:hypothetical protein